MTSLNANAYRADIDGLRAIAVLSVVFHHIGVPGFSGGFVGVDIFFVISGYLITRIIDGEIQGGQFSLSGFYERRIRRIFPALYPVLACSIAFGYLLLMPEDLLSLGKSVAATALFFSNILFSGESGYFDAPALQKPLRHTWSLAVEEQFYIVLPLLLVLIDKYARGRKLAVLLVLAILSFCANIYNIREHQTQVFYFAHTRAWELIVGSIIALRLNHETVPSLSRRILPVIGILLITCSVCFYDETLKYPGYFALAPVTGACMIIYAGSDNKSFVGRLLSLKPAVYIGLISYSLYLWHWPVIVYYKYVSFRELSVFEDVVIVILSVLLGYLSWRFVEQPFRRQSSPFIGRKIVILSGSVAVCLFAGIGIFYEKMKGFPDRHPKSEYYEMPLELDRYGLMKPAKSIDGVDIFRYGDENIEPSYIVWGDSHADRVALSVMEKSDEYHKSGYLAFHAGFIPLVGVRVNDSNSNLFGDGVVSFIRTHPNIKTVFLAGIWGAYANEHRYMDAWKVKLWDLEKPANNGSNVEVMRSGFVRTLRVLEKMGRRVVIVSDVPELGLNPKRLFWVRDVLLHGSTQEYLPSAYDYGVWNKEYSYITDVMLKDSGVFVLHPEKLLFDDNRKVMIVADKKLLYDDADHLSKYGTHFVSSIYDQVFDEM